MNSKKSLLVIFIIVFIDLIGFGIVVPILPYYAHSLGASAVTLGWLMMCYSGMQFLFSPFWGKLSDRIGRRPVLLICILGISLSMFLLGLAPSLFWLFAARLLTGFFGANISTAQAYIADITTDENRTRGMGLIGAAFGLGFLIGPALGGLASHWGYGTAPLVAGGISLLNFFLALAILKEPALEANTRRGHRSRPTQKIVKETLNNPQLALPIICFFISTLGMAQLETTFGLFLLARFKLDAIHAGLILALMALVMAGIQGGVLGRLVKKQGEIRLVMIGCGFMTLGLLLASVMTTIPLFIALLLIHAVGYALTTPSLSGLVSRYTSPDRQGATLGVYQSAGSLARVIGPIAAGCLFDHLGIASPFWVASLLFALALLTILWRKNVFQHPAVSTGPLVA